VTKTGTKTEDRATWEVLQTFTVNGITYTPGQKFMPGEYLSKTFPGSMEGRIENGFLRFTTE
jgi:hypothetical protein